MLKVYKSLIFVFIVFSTFNLCAQWSAPSSSAECGGQCIILPELPFPLSFCGEPVPMENFDVRESVQRELNSVTYWHSSMIYTLQLANRFMPSIESILKQNNIPDDIKYLCIAESNLQNLVSPARAAGYWQLLEGTAREFGLEVSADVDERYHLEKASLAACKYLRSAYNKFGSWTTAAASYNVGMAHMSRQIEDQKNKSYYNLHLNDETARYVYRALAFKIIMQNPTKFGFRLNGNALFPPLKFTEVAVSGSVPSWIDFAIKNGTNYKMLRYFNPWLRNSSLNNKAGKVYYIKIPEKNYRQTAY